MYSIVVVPPLTEPPCSDAQFRLAPGERLTFGRSATTTCRSTTRVHNWTGDGPFINNQTPGTVAKFYNKDGSVRWTSTAYQSGRATWDPIRSLQPCGA